MFDDRVCPSCQVLLREGTRTCPKCGRTVEAPKTHIAFIDIPHKIYSGLVRYFGPLGAGIVAGLVFLILLALLIARAIIKSSAAR